MSMSADWGEQKHGLAEYPHIKPPSFCIPIFIDPHLVSGSTLDALIYLPPSLSVLLHALLFAYTFYMALSYNAPVLRLSIYAFEV